MGDTVIAKGMVSTSPKPVAMAVDDRPQESRHIDILCIAARCYLTLRKTVSSHHGCSDG